MERLSGGGGGAFSMPSSLDGIFPCGVYVFGHNYSYLQW